MSSSLQPYNPVLVVAAAGRCFGGLRRRREAISRGAGATATVVATQQEVEATQQEAEAPPAVEAKLSEEASLLLQATRQAVAERAPEEGKAAAEVAALAPLFPHALDGTQLEACARYAEGKDVVCCMPTGSGKTVLGIFAVWRELLHGRRLFYTTPLKALSGQKRRELMRIFGPDAVGLVTGEHRILPDAPVVVMTTEICRNLLYPGAANLDGGVNDIQLLGAVVLDELHWMSDPDRGTAWEETIIHCPERVQLVGLSATVGGDPHVFCRWCASIRGGDNSCALVTSSVRAVPLHFYTKVEMPSRQRLFRLLADPFGSSKVESDDEPPELHQRLRALIDSGGGRGNPSAKSRRPPRDAQLRVVSKLRRLGWLPAISFVLNRKGCDQQVGLFAKAVGKRRSLSLLSQLDTLRVIGYLGAFADAHPEVSLSSDTKVALAFGAAAHHAGQLPAQRALVERLFEMGLIKVVFATETLAAGMNMPVRCVVINDTVKNDGQGRRQLNGSELLQMSGRAGRRGMDLLGQVVLNLHQPPAQMAHWMVGALAAGPVPLRSNFSPSYQMLCSLLCERSLKEVEAIVRCSFGAFLASARGGAEQEEDGVPAAMLEDARELRELRGLLDRSGLSMQSIEEYAALKGEVERQEKAAKEVAKIDSVLESIFGDPLEEGALLDDEAAGLTPGLVAQALAPRGVEEGGAAAAALAEVEKHEVHSSPLRDDVVQAVERQRYLRRSCSQMSSQQRRGGARAWPCFVRYLAVLEEAGFVASTSDPERPKVTELGSAAGRLSRGANALWLGRVLLPEPLGQDVVRRFDLQPTALAALVAAMTSEFSGDPSEIPHELVPEALQDAVAWIAKERWQVLETQWSHGVSEAVPLSLNAMCITRSWAQKRSWDQVSVEANTRGLADGDLYRCLRRTLEVLEGLDTVGPGLEGSPAWGPCVKAAIEAINRSPLTDNAALDDGEAVLSFGDADA